MRPAANTASSNPARRAARGPVRQQQGAAPRLPGRPGGGEHLRRDRRRAPSPRPRRPRGRAAPPARAAARVEHPAPGTQPDSPTAAAKAGRPQGNGCPSRPPAPRRTPGSAGRRPDGPEWLSPVPSPKSGRGPRALRSCAQKRCTCSNVARIVGGTSLCHIPAPFEMRPCVRPVRASFRGRWDTWTTPPMAGLPPRCHTRWHDRRRPRLCARSRARHDRPIPPQLAPHGRSALGTGIWTMHFVAMLGFNVTGTEIRYNVPLTILSLLVATILVVGAGSLRRRLREGPRPGPRRRRTHHRPRRRQHALPRHGGPAPARPSVSYAAAHRLGLSVAIAVVAATAALWAALNIKSPVAVAVASLVMGGAVSSMHYTGMLWSPSRSPPRHPRPCRAPPPCSSSSRSPSASAPTSS